MTRRILFFFFVSLFFVTLTSCEESSEEMTIGMNESVDTRFQDFYDQLGGQSVLGPAISRLFSNDSGTVYYQYTANSLMVYDTRASARFQYQLASLGREMGVAEPPMNPNSPDGHAIYPGFIDIYRSLGGSRIVGQPLTDVHADPERHRIVQYFDNLGFYQLEGDAPGVVHLLAYGAWKCASHCGYEPRSESIVQSLWAMSGTFDEAVDRLGVAFTGNPLTQQYIAEDGQKEQIFENIVVYANPVRPADIALRPIVELLGVSKAPLALPDDAPGMDFYEIEGGKGHNIPHHFWEYINQHSGFELSGDPITEYKRLSDELYRQCFENYCLDFYPNALDDLKVRPMDLGYNYRNRFFDDQSGAGGAQAVTLQVWETFAVIPPGVEQEIGVMVIDGKKGLKNIELRLTILSPEGTNLTYDFPLTGGNGESYVRLSGIDVPSSTYIEYEVCIVNIEGLDHCVREDYLVWGN